MSTTTVLVLYCLLILLASLAGGLVPLVVRLTHKRMQLAISLVAGFMLGVAVLHLLPHALMTVEPGFAAKWLIVGLLSMFFLERFFCFHHHDAPQDNPPVEDGAHAHDHGHTHDHGHSCAHHAHATLGDAQEHRLGWSGAAVGLTIHSVIAGVALSAAISSETLTDLHGAATVSWPGLAVFLVIVLHKPFDSLTLGTLMAAGGWSAASRHLVNALFALAVPLGAVLFQLGLAGTELHESRAIGAAVAFSAGVFLVVSLSDLLPELQFHHHDRGKLSAALLLGVVLAWVASHFEASTHDHDHGAHAPAAHVDHDDHAGHGTHDDHAEPPHHDDHADHDDHAEHEDGHDDHAPDPHGDHAH